MIVPHSISLMILGELSEYNGDCLYDFLTSFRSNCGKSFTGFQGSRGTFILAEDQAVALVDSIAACLPALSHHQLIDSPNHGFVVTFHMDRLSESTRVRLHQYLGLEDGESVGDQATGDGSGLHMLVIDPYVLLNAGDFPELTDFNQTVWQVLSEYFHTMYPWHLDTQSTTLH
jgi:hypothetical protein